jgi:hypothetical protein
VISPTQRPLSANTQHSQKTNIYAPSGIRTRNVCKRAAAEFNLCLYYQDFLKDFREIWYRVARNTYEGGPKNNRNLNVARELEVVTRCAARYHESRQYSSSLTRGVDLG